MSTRFPKSVSTQLQISQNPSVSTRLLTKPHWSLHSCPSEKFKLWYFLPRQFLWAIKARDDVSETGLIVFLREWSIFANLKTKYLQNPADLRFDYKIGNSPMLLGQILTKVIRLRKGNNKIVKSNLF